jgi:hypothetical protein
MEYWSKEMFSFVFLILTMCGGGVMAILGGIGCFVLAILGKDESTGEVRVGKLFNVKGVSLIVLSVCGVALMGYSVYSFTRIQASMGDSEYDWGFEAEGWGWDDDTSIDATPGVEEAVDDDTDDVVDPAVDVLDHVLAPEVIVGKGDQHHFLGELEYIEPPELDDDTADDDTGEEMQLLLDSLFEDMEMQE